MAATWTDGDLLAVAEATHLTSASGPQAQFREDWLFALNFLILSLDRDGADRARDLASARQTVAELAVKILEAEAARTISGAWTTGGPPVLTSDKAKEVERAMRRMVERCGATSPAAIRARVAFRAMQAVHDDNVWLRRQLETLGREEG